MSINNSEDTFSSTTSTKTSKASQEAASCAACSSASVRKTAITCNSCNERWHVSCVKPKLTVAQANALPAWHCSVCLGRTNRRVKITTSEQAQDAVKAREPCEEQVLDMPAELAKLREQTKIVRLIPKPARAAVASALSERIKGATSSSTPDTWWRLFSFAFIALRSPDRDNNRNCSLATRITRQVTEEHNYTQADLDPKGERLSSSPGRSSQERRADSGRTSDIEEDIARRVQAKCTDGDIGAALRTLTSDESLAQPTEDVISMLRLKHPPAPENENMPPPPCSTDTPLIVTEGQVRQSILSMPTGSAGGMDGIRPLHLRQLTSAETGEAGVRLLASLTALTNLVLAGQVPECARDALYCASLCAFRKKDGGLRPIAVGSVYRRLPARIAARFAADLLGPELRPVQLGVGTPLGCEAAVHAVRNFIKGATDQNTRVLVKIDVKNAFNTVRRDVILRCLRESCPEAYAMAYQAYSTPTPLLIAGQKVMSSTGVQQGDPLGPIAFALAVNSCASSLKSPLNVWYLDDATIGGPVAEVANDLRLITKTLPEVGLQLNPAKCEATVLDDLQHHATAIQEVKQALPDISETPVTRLQLLGSPLHEDSLQDATSAVVAIISRLCERVRLLDRHTGLFFLAHFVSAPRVTYLLRSTPLHSEIAGLRKIDAEVKATLSDVTNVEIADLAWAQASLPLRHGGLGIRSVQSLALPCYLASLCAAAPLVAAINPPSAADLTQCAFEPALKEFKKAIGSSDIPEGSAAQAQRSWDDLLCKAAVERLLEEANQVDRARLLAASLPHTGAWLQAIPVASLGLHLDPETVRVAVALRLGAPICEPHDCGQCGHPVDRQGHHGLSCKKSAGRFPRHTNLNDVVKRALASAGLPSVLEPQGLDRGDGKRPDGLTLFPYKQGKALAWDSTCVDTFSKTSVVRAALDPGAPAMAAELRKKKKYAVIAKEHIFVPVAVETTGVLGPAAAAFITEVGKRVTNATGDRREVAWLRQRIAIAIARGNAAAILATCRDATVGSSSGMTRRPPANNVMTVAMPQQKTASRTGSINPCQTAELVRALTQPHLSAMQDRSPLPPPSVMSREPPPPPVMASLLVSSARAEPTERSQPSTGEPCVQPSRDPLDDPELARYLQPRATVRSVQPVPTTQELNDELLRITPSDSCDLACSPRPNLLAGYAELLAELKEASRCGESDDGERPSD